MNADQILYTTVSAKRDLTHVFSSLTLCPLHVCTTSILCTGNWSVHHRVTIA